MIYWVMNFIRNINLRKVHTMKLTQLLTSLALMGNMSLCHAFSLETGVSTLGLGITASQHIYGDFSVKLNINDITAGMPYHGVSDALAKSSSSLNLLTAGLILDYNIWKGLNAEAGVYKFDGSAKSTIDYNGKYKVFTGSASDYNNLLLNEISPYLGLNYKTDLTKNLYLSSTIGVIFTQVQPQQILDADITSLGYNDHINNPLPPIFVPYPVVSLTLGYTF